MRQLPNFPRRQYVYDEISAFEGMNNTIHPTLLPNNVPSNLLNSYFSDGILKKRGGFARDGDYLTTKHSEEFTATTKKDSTNTTGEWTTDGAANLFTNSTASLDTSTTSLALGYPFQRHTVQSTTESTKYIVITYYDGGIKARKSANNGSTWTNLAGGAGETTITNDSSEDGQADWSLWIDSSDHIHMVYATSVGSPADYYIYYRKLTYSGGSWTVGSSSNIQTSPTSTSNLLRYVSCTITSGGTIWASYCDSSTDRVYVKSSTNGTSWSVSTIDTGTNNPVASCLLLNNDQPCIIYQYSVGSNYILYLKEYDGSAWGAA